MPKNNEINLSAPDGPMIIGPRQAEVMATAESPAGSPIDEGVQRSVEMKRIDLFDLAITDISNAKTLLKSALRRVSNAERLREDDRVLALRLQMLEKLPEIAAELSKFTDA